MLQSVDWSTVDEIRKYLEPFHVMASMFNHRSTVTFHMVQPEWFALIHEFSSDIEESRGSEDTSVWINDLKRRTEIKLRDATETVITAEHRMATVLNPRHKHLPVICSDLERLETYSRIRKLIGAPESNIVKGESNATTGNQGSDNGEPPKKRLSFLSSLEDHALIDDELECYLRSQYPALQTK
ncbi:unnamed protein product [Gongylonema pulchrum]|uniref:Uncharacterized protein n=1 Tax=Gongylonema pulchrum TaxID=637853 RepID=A0A3P6RD19_9BILA|nr:unnamed protein product [Gongylonema pulchrum]